MDGLTAIEHLCSEQPQVAVVILTTYNEDDLMLRGLCAGARGETLLKPEIMARLLSLPESRPHGDLDLTDRELKVLRAVARGERSKEIAARLSISERTVKAHLASIYNKLGVDSRAAAIAVASQRGLLLAGKTFREE